jgi:amino acid permease
LKSAGAQIFLTTRKAVSDRLAKGLLLHHAARLRIQNDTMAAKSRCRSTAWASLVAILPFVISFHNHPMHQRMLVSHKEGRQRTTLLPSVSALAPPRRQTKLKAKLDMQDTQTEGAASIPNLTTSLVKSIVGSGVLALPAGVATLGDAPNFRVVAPAILLICFIGIMNAYFFSLIGRICDKTGATSYRQAWELTVGEETGQLVAAVVAAKTLLSCLAFSIIVADSFQSLAVAAGLENLTRSEVLGVVTLFVLLPLCLQKNLSSLAVFSFLGLVGMGFTTSVMVLRYLDGSYSSIDDVGEYLSQVPANLQPSFGDSGPLASGVVLACTLATAFVAHYNAPRFHAELADNTVKRFNTVVGFAYAISAIVFAAVAISGFLTFGQHGSGFILNNYSPYDPLVTASRAAVALSIVFTYPLAFVGFRDGVMDVLRVQDRSDDLVTAVSVVLLLLVTVAAANVTDLALVLSVGGGTFSTAVASIFPAIMFRATIKDGESDKVDATVALVFMWISIAIGVTGVSIAVQNAMLK